MPQLQRWNVSAMVGVTLVRSSPEEAMIKVLDEIREIEIDGHTLSVGNITVKEA